MGQIERPLEHLRRNMSYRCKKWADAAVPLPGRCAQCLCEQSVCWDACERDDCSNSGRGGGEIGHGQQILNSINQITRYEIPKNPINNSSELLGTMCGGGKSC